MPNELDDDSDDPALVIFSLTVHSSHAIAALEGMRMPERKSGMPRPPNQYIYDVGGSSFEESGWSERATKLEAAVSEAIDRLEATGIDPEVLREPAVSVRAFFTFGPGAETIGADLVERLARYHATIWIDA